FTITNSGTIDSYYTISNEEDTNNSLDTKYLKYKLVSNDGYDSGIKTLDIMGNGYYILSSENLLSVGESVAYKLYIWLSSEADNTVQGKTYRSKIVVQSTTNSIGGTVATALLKGIGSNGSIDTSDSEQTFITGTDPNNYIWYSGKLWRAVSIDTTDNSVKLITQWGISALPYTSNKKSDFKGSYIEKWLNNTSVDGFLGSLREPEKFIKTDSVWNATITSETIKPTKTTLVSAAVGLINLYEYTMSYKNIDSSSGYLNNNLWWFLLNSASSDKWQNVNEKGNIEFNNSYSFAVRPSINLQPNIKIASGRGTSDDPYRLAGDDDQNLSGILLSTRYSGEYINFGIGENNLYRIVSHEDGVGTKITSAIPLRKNNSFVGMSYDENLSVKYTASTTLGNFLNNSFLTSEKYISSEQVKMIEDNTMWYLGTVFANDNPNNIKDLNDKISLKIGMLRLGELMACQQSYFSPNNVSFRLLTPYSSTEIRDIGGSGDSYHDSPSIKRGIRPAMNLKTNVVITSGDGTKNNPFKIKLNN
ncbi:hypothetical protein EGP98_04160, partial [bacterium]|nr:hypothetical protein [bacterium]